NFGQRAGGCLDVRGRRPGLVEIAQRLVRRQGELAGLVDPLLALLDLLRSRRPRGCWVTSEYGPVERAWILSSTRWRSLRMYMEPTVTFCSKGVPVRPFSSRTFPEQRRPGGRFWSTTNLIGE